MVELFKKENKLPLPNFAPPELIKDFQQIKLAREEPGIVALTTPQLAAWACETARVIIVAVLDLIKDSPSDSTGMFKLGFRKSMGTK